MNKNNSASDTKAQPVIVGAGPVGLAAALFLAKRGIQARVIEKLAQPSVHSKALAVNPRTMDLLQESGVTDQMLALGRPMRGAMFHSGGKPIAEADLKTLGHKHSFLLGLSQATTERLLFEAAAKLGVEVEREVEVTACEPTESESGLPKLQMQHARGASEEVNAKYVFAADGAHSVIRHQLDVEFPGSSFDRPWSLVDVPLKTSLPNDIAHLVWVKEGFLFMMPVITGEKTEGPEIWRVLGNMPDPLAAINVDAQPAGPTVWESSFHISHRVVEQFHVGGCYFAGDAAHIHSPAGARGMNLGIEDAWVFAELASRGELNRYHTLRHQADTGVVRRIERITRIARGESVFSRFVRTCLLPIGARVPAIRSQMLKTISGLDHDLGIRLPQAKMISVQSGGAKSSQRARDLA